jgi:hypothetical protein
MSAVGIQIEKVEIERHANRVTKLLPRGDMLLAILKGHLLIEESLQGIIDAHMQNPSALKKEDASFRFIQKLRLAEALCNKPDSYGVMFWGAIKELNKILNYLSHNVDAPDLNAKIDTFLEKYAGKSGPLAPMGKLKDRKLSRRNRLVLALARLCGHAARVKILAAQVR